ncbi:MAG: DnaA regulatory inactivator Hda [Sulfuriferula sp.]|jgi:DnaA-homolog protein|nr:DnaA regulatory inactivator Hda [Sulfuriferula sp.]
MQQLVLDIVPTPPPRFDNFIPAANAELVQAVNAIATQQNPEPQLYLWGDSGSGKTHLLQASVHLALSRNNNAVYVDASELAAIDPSAFEFIAIDNVERLGAADQIKLFNLINHMREGHGRLIAAGLIAPMQLPLRSDLTTRLGWGLVYQIHPLSDADKLSVLSRHAQARGFELHAGVADYLMRHWRRDLPSLIAALDSLDHYSLQTRRPITVPLLKEVLG